MAMEESVLSYEFISKNRELVETVELDEKLVELYKEHNKSMDKSKLPTLLFILLKTVSREKKRLVYEYLKMIRNDITKVDVDVLEMIKSKDAGIKRLGLKISYLFWEYFKNDEVIVHNVSNCRRFYKLFKEDPKYSMVYKKKIMRCEKDVEKYHNALARSAKRSYPTEETKKRSRCWIIPEIRRVKSLDDLKIALSKYAPDGDGKVIADFFIHKIEISEAEDYKGIPGISAGNSVVSKTSKIDPSLALVLSGLDNTKLYKEINDIFNKMQI